MTQETPLTEAVITVVTYNSAADIELCIRSLAEHFPHLFKRRAEVHVVDNASKDETREILNILAQEFDWLKLYFRDENLGFGSGNNLVLNSVPAKAYVMLNADAWLVADSLSPALAHISTHAETGIIGLPLVYPNGAPQTYAFMPSAWHRWLLLMIGLRGLAKWLVSFPPARAMMRLVPFTRNFAANHSKPWLDLANPDARAASATGEVRPAYWVAGAAMVLSPEFVAASGGFDPAIFLYGEDEDLCIQAHRLGFAVQTLDTVPIVHKLGWGSGEDFRPQVARMKYDSLRYFIAKNVKPQFNRAIMRVLLPFYVYGRNVGHFFRGDS